MARPWEFAKEGITAATLARMRQKGLILQLSRGLYQLPGDAVDTNHSLAEAAMSVSKGVVCLVSALAFHELTDTIPRSVWMAIGPKHRRPAVAHPPLQIVRFRDKMLSAGVEEHRIEGVSVHIYNPAKTVVDLFRYRQSAGRRYKKVPASILHLRACGRPCGSARRRPRRSPNTLARRESGKLFSPTSRR